jgi:hypothetical protein
MRSSLSGKKCSAALELAPSRKIHLALTSLTPREAILSQLALGRRRHLMAITLLPAASSAIPFPAPGVAAGIRHAIAAVARETRPGPVEAPHLDGEDRSVNHTFVARRLHIVRRDVFRRPARAFAPSPPA